MCGIAGIISGRADCRLADPLEAMMRLMAHRGPDGEGTWIDARAGVALGHKRLAIIDPERGRQPMTNEDETVWITFNGCIYNFEDLMRELRQSGHQFRTHCDTEVILHAYEQWGEECVSRFNGMWAFALWDSRTQTLFCSRDRIGIKPFYYAWDGETFLFGSEIKALIGSKLMPATLDQDGLRHFLTFQYCLGERTLFNGVHRLDAGCNLRVSLGGEPAVWRYWDIHFIQDHDHTEKYFVERMAWLIEDAVRLRLRSDVSLGAHLSGGLDSSTVVCMARMLLGDLPLRTFTGAFDNGDQFDETRYAKLVADAAATEYHDCYLTPQHFVDSIEAIMWHMDEPAAGPGVFPQYWVSELASRHVKVVLGGQGGDEIFIGYARYLVAYLEECIKGAIEDTAHRNRYVATLETIVPSLPDLEQYVPMLRDFWREGLFGEPARRYFRLTDRFVDTNGFISPDLRIDEEKTFEEFQAIFNNHGAVAKINRILYFDVHAHLQSLLHVEDRTSMAHGLESRVPLLDYRLIELMASIPPVTKFKNGQLKYLFRQAISELVPTAIQKRRDKMGFPVPLNIWLKSELREFAQDVLLGRTTRQRGLFNMAVLQTALEADRPFSRALWGALCLELWHRQFLDRDPDRVSLASRHASHV